MIKIESITMEHFRGVRQLRLDLKRNNYAVCGPNGTGKSGIVDAIEFAITGNITRLSGEGTSGITVKQHAPHVDQRTHPERARVTLSAYVPSLDKSFSLERRVSSPGQPIIRPNSPEVLAIVAGLELHPEFALTRREILKYVLAPAGERSKEVQALLRLERVDRVRLAFQNIATSLKNEKRGLLVDMDQAKRDLLKTLGVEELRGESLLAVVNSRRSVLRLPPIEQLQKDTSLKEGLDAGLTQSAPPGTVRKDVALSLVSGVIDFITGPEPRAAADARAKSLVTVRRLVSDPQLLKNFKRRTFLTTGSDLVDDALAEAACPLCDTPWDMRQLRLRIQEKLKQASEAAVLSDRLRGDVQPLVAALRELEGQINGINGLGAPLLPQAEAEVLSTWQRLLHEFRELLTSQEDIPALERTLDSDYRQVPVAALPILQAVAKRVGELPDPSKENAARDYLVAAQERLEIYRGLKRRESLVDKRSELVTRVAQAYNGSATQVLTGIYKKVELDFSRFYRFINRDDEASFEGKLTPSLGKLGFDVDFYGRGRFPPGAYHSEGHQDAMGLCLYLALMKHTLGDGFTFAVLDDVLMSVDAGHRREVCGLLKLEFPKTQFIVTTHDPIWLNHMKTEQLVPGRASIRFRKWTVDNGPLLWDDKEVWQEIQEALDTDAVPDAAGVLRRYLEYVFSVLCGRLRARVEYRDDAQYELEDVLPPACSAWKELLKSAIDVAQSWGKKEEIPAIKKRLEEFTKAYERSQAERWAINKSVHYNEWVTLRKPDFAPVVEAFKSLVSAFQCDSCRVFAYVVPAKGSREGVRCDCAATSFNLKRPDPR